MRRFYLAGFVLIVVIFCVMLSNTSDQEWSMGWSIAYTPSQSASVFYGKTHLLNTSVLCLCDGSLPPETFQGILDLLEKHGIPYMSTDVDEIHSDNISSWLDSFDVLRASSQRIVILAYGDSLDLAFHLLQENDVDKLVVLQPKDTQKISDQKIIHKILER